MSRHRTPAEIATIKAKHDLRDLVEALWGPPKRRTRDYVQYVAPDRPERTASLTIWPDGFKDFGDTRPGGDHFTFLERYEGLDFKTALNFLAGPENAKATKLRHKARRSRNMPSTSPGISSSWNTHAQQMLQRCQEILSHSPQVVQFLTELGYTKDTILARGLGFNPTWTKLGWTDDNGNPAWLPPGIVYPWAVDGQLYALKVRCPFRTNDGDPDALAQLMRSRPQRAKYMQAAGGNLRQSWYGERSNPTHPVIFTEGEKDRDLLWQVVGAHVDVITLGSATGQLPAELVEQLRDAPWVAVVLDNDNAGYENARRLRRDLSLALPHIPVITPSVPYCYNDVAEWLHTLPTDPSLPIPGPVATWLADMKSLTDRLRVMSYIPADELYVLPQGLPDTLRELILGLHTIAPQGKRYIKDQANMLLVLELLYNMPDTVLNGPVTPSITIRQLKDAMPAAQYAVSDASLRRGLKQCEAVGFLSTSPPLPKHHVEGQGVDFAKNPVCESETPPNTPQPGRPAQRWYVVPLAQALAAFIDNMTQRYREALYADAMPDIAHEDWFADIVDPATALDAAEAFDRYTADLRELMHKHLAAAESKVNKQRAAWQKALNLNVLAGASSTPLHIQQPLSCGRDYRDAYYAALVAAAGPYGRQIARAKAARQIGVDPKTLSQVRRRTQIIATPNFAQYRVDDDLPGHVDVVRMADRLARWAAGREFGRYFENDRGEMIRVRTDAPAFTNHWVHAQLQAGHRVVLKVQVASREHFATAEELQAREQERAYFSALGQAAATSRHQRETSVHHSSLMPPNLASIPLPPAQDISPDGPTRGYVVDQVRGCLLWLDERREEVLAAEPALRAVAVALRLWPPEKGSGRV